MSRSRISIFPSLMTVMTYAYNILALLFTVPMSQVLEKKSQILDYYQTFSATFAESKFAEIYKFQLFEDLARTYLINLQTPLRLPEFFPIGQWNRFEQTEVRHLTDPLALKLVHNGVHNGVRNWGCNVVFSNQEFRREGWTEKRSAVCFCLGSGLFGSYNSD